VILAMLFHALVMSTVVCLALAGALAVALARVARRARRPSDGGSLSPVCRQHFELFQGEPVDEAAIARSRARLERILSERGPEAAEASIKPGLRFVSEARALAEIGTVSAGRTLERLLERKLSGDPLEMLWYRLDLAGALRALNRSQALPALLRLADESPPDVPLASYLAAEICCFIGFGGILKNPTHPECPKAKRVLRQALEGLRQGLDPARLAEARMGEMVEFHWDSAPRPDDPDSIRLLAEALRITRRIPAYEAFLPDSEETREAWRLQASRLTVLESEISGFLQQCVAPLASRLPTRDQTLELGILKALDDIRADAARWLIPLLSGNRLKHRDFAISLLSRSRDDGTARFLGMWIHGHVDPGERASGRRAPSPSPGEPKFPYEAALRSLKGHASPEVEELLLQAACDPEAAVRAAAVSSLGWQEPIALDRVRSSLAAARTDREATVRFAARAALARLGERASLDVFRKGLASADPHQALLSIHAVAEENLTLLWPEVDARADAPDAIVAHHAREALALLAEESMPPAEG